MQPAADGLSPDLEANQYGEFAFPIVANFSAELNDDPKRVAPLLIDQITGAVRWVETIETLLGLGIDVFIEFGPSTVLTGLLKRIAPEARAINVGTVPQLEGFEAQNFEV